MEGVRVGAWEGKKSVIMIMIMMIIVRKASTLIMIVVTLLFLGSIPAAKYMAALLRESARNFFGSCGAVMACKSTTQK